MSAEASTSVAVSTIETPHLKDFLGSVQQFKPPAYMLNTRLKSRVYQTFVTGRIAINTLDKVTAVAKALDCEPIMNRSTRYHIDGNNRVAFANDSDFIEIWGREGNNPGTRIFDCDIAKGDDTVYRSQIADNVLYEDQAPRSSGQLFEDPAFEGSSFCSIPDRERSFRLWAAPDPDREKTLLAGKRTGEGSQVMVFRPNHGIVFHHDHDVQRKTHTVKVWTHGGELMWHSVHSIGLPTDVRCCNRDLIESECQKWAALDNAPDTTNLAARALVQAEQVTTDQHGRRDFFREPGEYNSKPPEPRLSEMMTAASAWGDLPPSREAEGSPGRRSHPDYHDTETLSPTVPVHKPRQRRWDLVDETHGHGPNLQDNANEVTHSEYRNVATSSRIRPVHMPHQSHSDTGDETQGHGPIFHDNVDQGGQSKRTASSRRS